MKAYHPFETSLELESWAKQRNIPLIGVYSRNTIPQKLRSGGYIVNLDTNMGSGTHWVAFYVALRCGDNTTASAAYFDSFGVVPPLEVQDSLKGYQTVYNTLDIQSLSTGGCGLYCLLFIEMMYYLRPLGSLPNRLEFFDHLWSQKVSQNLPRLKRYLRITASSE